MKVVAPVNVPMLVLVVVNVPVSTVPAALLVPAKRIVKF